MITKLDQLRRRSGYISRAMVLPLLLIIFCAFAVKLTRQNSMVHHPVPDEPITIVVDAGHGGIDPGAKSETGLSEKDITLSITRKIYELAPQYNIKVVLTRNSDILPGNASTIQDGLHKRVEISDQIKPDAFISIHVNSGEDKSTSNAGFDAWVSGRKDDEPSKKLATAILNRLKNVYTVSEIIHQSPRGIWVLDKSNCPAVIIECGYIDNPTDAAFISSKENQEKVAKDILDAVVQFHNHQFVMAAGTYYFNKADTLTPLQKLEKDLNEKKVKQLSVYTRKDDFVFKYENGDSIIISKKDVDYQIQKRNHDPKAEKYQADKIFTKVEIEPEYPGGQSGWINYLQKNLKYPKAAISKEIQGTVVVQFIVDKDGKVSDVKALDGPKELQEESIRIVKESGNWLSGVQNGKKVKVYKKQPIIYKLS